MPKQILTDQGREFESSLFLNLLDRLGVDKVRTSPYNPSTNGCVERFHRTLNSMLAKTVQESQKDWDLCLPYVLAAYKASIHSATGYMPNYLFLGRENRMPVDLIYGLPPNTEPLRQYHEFVENVTKRSLAAYKCAKDRLKVLAVVGKERYDVKVRKIHLVPEDLVWYLYPKLKEGRYQKWHSVYTVPYLVEKILPPCNVVIQKGGSKTIVVHINKLKKKN